MAVLYIAEYLDIDGTRQVPREPPLVEQTIAISSSSAPSVAFSAKTYMIRVHTDAICSVVVGTAGTTPVATATNARMAANQTEYRGVQPGQILAVITNT